MYGSKLSANDLLLPPVVTIGKDTYYTSIFVFLERAKDYITSDCCPAKVIATQLSRCLRGVAHLWYVHELTTIVRDGLRASVDHWFDALNGRFKSSPEQAFHALSLQYYGPENVEVESQIFVQRYILYVKTCGLTDTPLLLLTA